MIPPGKSHSVRLCATFVRTVSVPGRYGDGYGGLGLSLLVTPRKSGGLTAMSGKPGFAARRTRRLASTAISRTSVALPGPSAHAATIQPWAADSSGPRRTLAPTPHSW